MLKTIAVILLSFFAVIGFVECVLELLETASVAYYRDLEDVALVAQLNGRVKNVPFLLNTLLLQAARIRYRGTRTRVVIRDNGLDESTYTQIHSFCEENDDISVEI